MVDGRGESERVSMKVRCPRCGKEAEWEGNSFRPFCSDRCKLIDLGKWMSDDYVIREEAANEKQEDEEGA